MKFLISLCFFALILTQCKSPQPKITELGTNIGSELQVSSPLDLPTLIQNLEGKDSIRTQLKAKVESVCQVKGCWMNLISDQGSAEQSIFVKFKDYAFFMPLDLAGNEVIIEGVAFREVTSVDELRHYAEDEGKSAEEIEAIIEPAEELKFMADGVIILDK